MNEIHTRSNCCGKTVVAGNTLGVDVGPPAKRQYVTFVGVPPSNRVVLKIMGRMEKPGSDSPYIPAAYLLIDNNHVCCEEKYDRKGAREAKMLITEFMHSGRVPSGS